MSNFVNQRLTTLVINREGNYYATVLSTVFSTAFDIPGKACNCSESHSVPWSQPDKLPLCQYHRHCITNTTKLFHKQFLRNTLHVESTGFTNLTLSKIFSFEYKPYMASTEGPCDTAVNHRIRVTIDSISTALCDLNSGLIDSLMNLYDKLENEMWQRDSLSGAREAAEAFKQTTTELKNDAWGTAVSWRCPLVHNKCRIRITEEITIRIKESSINNATISQTK